MATVAEFTIPPDAFPLGTIFDHLPDATVEFDRLVPTKRAVVPYVWIYGVDLDATATPPGFASDPGVGEVSRVDSVDGKHLFRVRWDLEHQDVLPVLVETRTALDSAVGTDERWTFEVRGDDRDAVADMMTALEENGVPATLTSLHDLEPGSFDDFDLTDAQREALTLAHERGYYESPRKTTLDELADELDISRQALGSRLRRGLDQLLAATVT